MSTFLHYVHCKDALLDCSSPGGERCESLTWVDEITSPVLTKVLRRGLLKFCSWIILFQEISIYQNSRLDTLNHNHIWQVSPQLSCGDTCQIWVWYFIDNVCFESAENLGKKKQTEEIGLANPTPGVIIGVCESERFSESSVFSGPCWV